jgi:hypothetical protein
MNKEFIPHEQAVELKELGFDGETMCVYNSYKHLKSVIVSSMDGDYAKREKWEDRLPAPTFSQCFRWFREKYNLYGLYMMGDDWNNFYFHIWRNDTMTKTFVTSSNWVYETYEEAELACLKKLIEIVKEKKD